MVFFLLIICIVSFCGCINAYHDGEMFNAIFLLIISIGSLIYLINLIICDIKNEIYNIGNNKHTVYNYVVNNSNLKKSSINNQITHQITKSLEPSNINIKIKKVDDEKCELKSTLLKSNVQQAQPLDIGVNTQNTSKKVVVEESSAKKTTYIFVQNKHTLSDDIKKVYDIIISIYQNAKYTDNVITESISRFKYIDIFGGNINIYVKDVKQIFHTNVIKEHISKELNVNQDKINFLDYHNIELIDYYNKFKIKENEHNYTSDY